MTKTRKNTTIKVDLLVFTTRKYRQEISLETENDLANSNDQQKLLNFQLGSSLVFVHS